MADGNENAPMHVYIEDIGKHEGEAVIIKGWLHNRRSSGKIHFLTVRDGSGFIQAVMSKAAVGEDLFKAADHLSQETSVIVTGTARADKRAPSGSRRSCASVTRSSTPSATSSTTAASSSPTHRSSRLRPAKARRRCSRR